MLLHVDAVKQRGVWRVPASTRAQLDSTNKPVQKFVIIKGSWNVLVQLKSRQKGHN